MNGNSEQAEEYATRALAQARSTGNAEQETVALTRLGMAAYTMSVSPGAQVFCRGARVLREGTLSDRDEHVQILLTLGSITLRTGSWTPHRAKSSRRWRGPRSGQQTREAEALQCWEPGAERGDRDNRPGPLQEASTGCAGRQHAHRAASL